MWNIHPALAPSVFILLLADPAMRRGIPMRLDTPDRLVRGSPAIQSYRYGFLLASRIVRAHRVRHSIALIAPSVPDRIMAVHRSAHPSGVTCIDRIAVFARLPGISRPPNRTSVLWARCAALDAARVGNDSPRRPDVFRLDSRLGRDDREAASFAHSALYRHPAGLSLFYGSRLPMGGRDRLDAWSPAGLCDSPVDPRPLRASVRKRDRYGVRTPIANRLPGTPDRTTESRRSTEGWKWPAATASRSDQSTHMATILVHLPNTSGDGCVHDLRLARIAMIVTGWLRLKLGRPGT